MADKKQGQRMLVTAGAFGLGLEIARVFVRAGDTVAVCDVDQVAVADREGCARMVVIRAAGASVPRPSACGTCW